MNYVVFVLRYLLKLQWRLTNGLPRFPLAVGGPRSGLALVDRISRRRGGEEEGSPPPQDQVACGVWSRAHAIPNDVLLDRMLERKQPLVR